MKTKLKKLFASTAIAVAVIFSSSAFSLAHAEKVKVILDHVYVTDDGDYRPGPAGEITFTFSVNGISESFYAVVNDKKNRTRLIKNYLKKNQREKVFNVNPGQSIAIIARGSEHDRVGTDRCYGERYDNSFYSQGVKTIKCKGSVAYTLYYKTSVVR